MNLPFPMKRRLVLAFASAVALSSSVEAQRPLTSPQTRADLVVTPAWLAKHLTDPAVVVIEVVQEIGESTKHIPGSHEIPYMELIEDRNGLEAELPAPESLKKLFEGVGISDRTRVIVYAAHAPMATRMLLTLATIGHDRFSYLDGGFPRWEMEHLPVDTSDARVAHGKLTLAPKPSLVVDASWLTTRLGKPGLAMIDTRTPGEYDGSGDRNGIPSAGHLSGAQQLEWESLFEKDQPLQLKSTKELRALFADRAKDTDTVVTYCWVGYRASATWFAARLLSYDARLYDGSYQDWKLRKLPVMTGAKPQ